MIRIRNFTPRLPNEYQEVEYIQSTGTQYIDTGVAPTNKTNIKLDIDFISGESDRWIPLIAERTKLTNSYQEMFSIWINSNTKEIALNYNSKDTSAIEGTNGDGRHIYSNSKNKFYLDNTLFSTLSTSSFTSALNLYVFALNELYIGSTNIETRNCTAKLYELKIYDDSTLIRDFAPCYRKSDNEVGLYDLVNNAFYTNAGTGVFLMGEAVGTTDANLMPMIGNKKVLKRYIGENLVYGEENTGYEQKINYTMLYDCSYNDITLNKCPDVTGGWTKGFNSKNFTSSDGAVFLDEPTGITFGEKNKSGYSCYYISTNKKIDLTDYVACFMKSYNTFYGGNNNNYNVTINIGAPGDVDNWTPGDILYQTSSQIPTGSWYTVLQMWKTNDYTATKEEQYLTTHVTKTLKEKFAGEKYLDLHVDSSAMSYYYLFIKLYYFTLFKEDSWQSLLASATSIDDVLDASETILNSEEKVEYMLYNCTGSFMATAICSETFLTALESSPYKTKIYANEHWNKFLNMVV